MLLTKEFARRNDVSFAEYFEAACPAALGFTDTRLNDEEHEQDDDHALKLLIACGI